MNQANPRRANTPMISGALPAIDDRELVRRILTLPLGETFRTELETLLPKIEKGKFGVLKKSMRDRLFKLALESNIIERIKSKNGIGISINNATYETRVVEGTAFAEDLISRFVPSKGGRMPVPPGRRVA